MKQHTLILSLATVFAFAVLLSAFLFWLKPSQVEGSSIVGNDYQSTTTGAFTDRGNTITTDKCFKQGGGSLGSVLVTGAAAGQVYFYDATTTNPSLRAAQFASSSILIMQLPISYAASNIVIDKQVNFGICVVIVGTAPTTTITYR